MTFGAPWVLALLLVVPLWVWRQRRLPLRSVRFSRVEGIAKLPPTIRQRWMWLPPFLTVAAVVVLIVALAQPREGRRRAISTTQGIAIELIVDRSGSMQAMDFRIDGQPVDRLTAIKNVAGRFVLGRDEQQGFSFDVSPSGDPLAGRPNDMIGLITFAGYADAQAPPTLDHRFLVKQLNDTGIVSRRKEDGTAIGDAIALAVEKLHALDARQQDQVQGKVIILLTDGENNAGAMDPGVAAELAQTMGVKIYTIGVGTQGRAPVPIVDLFGRKRLQYMDVNIDEETLRQVAQATGGQYFRATDTQSLQQIYEQIDQLEKTEVQADHYVDYRELAVESWQTTWVTVPPFLFVAAALLAAAIGLESTWLSTL